MHAVAPVLLLLVNVFTFWGEWCGGDGGTTLLSVGLID